MHDFSPVDAPCAVLPSCIGRKGRARSHRRFREHDPQAAHALRRRDGTAQSIGSYIKFGKK
jgi:hypothetical protein